MDTKFSETTFTTVVAKKISHHVKLKQLEQSARGQELETKYLSESLVICDSNTIYICFSSGIVVQWATNELKNLPKFIISHYEESITDTDFFDITEKYTIQYSDQFSIENGIIILNEKTLEILVSISHALARSVQIEYDEQSIHSLLIEMKHIPEQLQKTGHVRGRNKDIRRMIGTVLQTKHNISTFGIADDHPELLWEDDTLRKYYRITAQDLELNDRRTVLSEKISFLEDMLSILRDEIHTKHGHLLEWAIVLLIIFEIFLYFLEK